MGALDIALGQAIAKAAAPHAYFADYVKESSMTSTDGGSHLNSQSEPMPTDFSDPRVPRPPMLAEYEVPKCLWSAVNALLNARASFHDRHHADIDAAYIRLVQPWIKG